MAAPSEITRTRGKCLPTIEAAIDACEIRDGATISFHHHLRNGDHVLNDVLAVLASRGVKHLTVAASSLFPVHAPLIDHIRSGVVAAISATYIAGPLGAAVAQGLLPTPVRMMTHGGRARAIAAGELSIDAFFMAAPAADAQGNVNGVDGPTACGTLGYALVDARHARRVVAVTDHLVSYPLCPVQITQENVDHVVVVERIGDAAGIASGTTQATEEAVGRSIARTAVDVMQAAGALTPGFSFQTGAGSISLAVADELREVMVTNGLQGSFASGGITAYLVDLFERGLFQGLFDVQCFDLTAVDSFRRNTAHQEMSVSLYASPGPRGAIVDQLDVVVLGAAEVDIDFNVNVTTGADGLIMGGSGGHADTAAGAALTIVTTRLNAGGFQKVVERVATVTTPGRDVDVLVTDGGIAVNPKHPNLSARLRSAGLTVVPVDQLAQQSRQGATRLVKPVTGEQVAAVLEYRDGSVIDVVHAVSETTQ